MMPMKMTKSVLLPPDIFGDQDNDVGLNEDDNMNDDSNDHDDDHDEDDDDDDEEVGRVLSFMDDPRAISDYIEANP